MELTLEYALKNNFTANDCVKFFKPKASEDFCEFILWEKTCFPCDNEIMIKQLNSIFNKKNVGTDESER